MKPKIIAIDGYGGAGKSTLASKLSADLGNCPIIHTDGFATHDGPPWPSSLLEQVLLPLSRGESARFQKYDWHKRELSSEWTEIQPAPFMILEGVSSSRNEFRPYLAFSIYVETPRDICLTRGLKRDGEHMRDFWENWMQQEDLHFAKDDAKKNADVIVNGTETVDIDTIILKLN